MAVKVVINGLGNFRRRLKKINTEINSALRSEMGKIVVEMHEDVITTISRGGRSGRIYGKHQASAPGEPPKTDTGELVASITPKVTSTKGVVTGIISARAQHAAPLEFKPAALGGRPFMRPLYKRWENRINTRLGLKVINNIRTKT